MSALFFSRAIFRWSPMSLRARFADVSARTLSGIACAAHVSSSE
jgi:hypothetical protein